MPPETIRQVVLNLDSTATYARDLIRGIAQYSIQAGPWIFYREPDLAAKGIDELRNLKADGLVASALGSRAAYIVLELGLPLVIFVENPNDPELEHISTISTSDTEIGQMAASHLLGLGLSRFGFYGCTNEHWSNERRRGFAEHLGEYEHRVAVMSHPLKSEKTRYDEVLEISRWVDGLEKPVGIMACNDIAGQHVLQACKVIGANVPEEVAVIGVDNDDLICDLTDPPMSSIALDSKQAGYRAAKVLDGLMQNRENTRNRIFIRPTQVVTRHSTDVVAVEDKQVAAAIQFIRKHSNRLIGVNDVCDEVSISRRQLERKFRKALKRSINHEIRIHRAQQVVNMLVRTNLTLSQIAENLEFNGLHHMGRLFKSIKGITPVEYRKKYVMNPI